MFRAKEKIYIDICQSFSEAEFSRPEETTVGTQSI
jgi:hypothetical protein